MSEQTTRQLLIAACRAARADNLPRLVFADYLDETGSEADAARARLIRRQCGEVGIASGNAMWALPCDCELCRDTQVLFPCGDFADGLYLKTDRGFLTEAECPAEWWLRHADSLVAEHDVQRVRLTTWPEVEVVGETRPHVRLVARFAAYRDREQQIGVPFRQNTMLEGDQDAVDRLLHAHWPEIQFEIIPHRYTTREEIAARLLRGSGDGVGAAAEFLSYP